MWTASQINSFSLNIDTDVLKNIKNCFRKSTSTASDEELTKRNKFNAKQAYDILIQMNGKFIHRFRSQFIWKIILINEFLYWRNEKLKKNRCELKNNYIDFHWTHERIRFQKKLRQWQRFRDFQQRTRDGQQDKKTKNNSELQQHVQNQHFAACLTRLKNWKKYRVYQQKQIDHRKKWIEKYRRAVKIIEQKVSEMNLNKLTFKNLNQHDFLRKLNESLKWLKIEKQRFEWIKQQFPLIFSKCVNLLIETSFFCRQMKKKMKIDIKRIYASLINTGEKSIRSIRPVFDVEENDQVNFLFVLCHWQNEYSQFENQLIKWKKFKKYLSKKEFDENNEFQLQKQQFTKNSIQLNNWKKYQTYQLTEWKKFRKYLSKKKFDENNESQLQTQQFIKNSTRLNIWKKYQAYQLMKMNNAKKMIKFWQRQTNFYQQIKKTCWQMMRKHYKKNFMTNVLNFNEFENKIQKYRSCAEENEAHVQKYRFHAETKRSHVESAQQQIRFAKLRLKWIEQQIQSIFSK